MQVFMQPLEKLSEYGELKDRLPKHKGLPPSFRAVWNLRKPI